jgi:hypothetical protein
VKVDRPRYRDVESRRFKQRRAYRGSLRRRHLTRSFQVGLVRCLNDRLEELAPVERGLILVKTHHTRKSSREPIPKYGWCVEHRPA